MESPISFADSRRRRGRPLSPARRLLALDDVLRTRREPAHDSADGRLLASLRAAWEVGGLVRSSDADLEALRRAHADPSQAAATSARRTSDLLAYLSDGRARVLPSAEMMGPEPSACIALLDVGLLGLDPAGRLGVAVATIGALPAGGIADAIGSARRAIEAERRWATVWLEDGTWRYLSAIDGEKLATRRVEAFVPLLVIDLGALTPKIETIDATGFGACIVIDAFGELDRAHSRVPEPVSLAATIRAFSAGRALVGEHGLG